MTAPLSMSMFANRKDYEAALRGQSVLTELLNKYLSHQLTWWEYREQFEGFIEAESGARFYSVGCSQCGKQFGPGNEGFSHCDDHGSAA